MPADFERMKQQLRRDLLEEHSRRYGRPRRRLGLQGVAAGVLLVLVVAFASLAWDQEEAEAGVRVIVEGGFISVLLDDVESRPEDIEQAALEHDLRIEVEPVPVGPSMVGRFIGQSGDRPISPQFTVVGDDGSSFRGFRLPLDWSGSLDLKVGRSADRGEPWTVPSNALAPGESLACLKLLGLPLAEVLEQLTERELSARAFVMDGGSVEVMLDSLGPYSTWRVSDLSAISSDEILVDASIDGSSFKDGELPEMPPGC